MTQCSAVAELKFENFRLPRQGEAMMCCLAFDFLQPLSVIVRNPGAFKLPIYGVDKMGPRIGKRPNKVSGIEVTRIYMRRSATRQYRVLTKDAQAIQVSEQNGRGLKNRLVHLIGIQRADCQSREITKQKMLIMVTLQLTRHRLQKLDVSKSKKIVLGEKYTAGTEVFFAASSFWLQERPPSSQIGAGYPNDRPNDVGTGLDPAIGRCGDLYEGVRSVNAGGPKKNRYRAGRHKNRAVGQKLPHRQFAVRSIFHDSQRSSAAEFPQRGAA